MSKQYLLTLRLTSKLVDLRVANANRTMQSKSCALCSSKGRVGQKNKTVLPSCFLSMDYKKDIFAFSVCGVELTQPNHGEAVYIINSARDCISPTRSAVYHHCEARYTLPRDNIQTRFASLMICTTLRAAMIYHCFAMDKKSADCFRRIFGLPERIRTADLQSRSLTRYPAVPRADIYS